MSTPAFVIGNLTRDPQLNHTSEGTPVTNLTLADNTRRLVDSEWVDGPVTFWVVAAVGSSFRSPTTITARSLPFPSSRAVAVPRTVAASAARR
jgi:single-stranded DNA-binding protein